MSYQFTPTILRAMAWERAKGELASMLRTFYDDPRYRELKDQIHAFTKYVEENGLVE